MVKFSENTAPLEENVAVARAYMQSQAAANMREVYAKLNIMDEEFIERAFIQKACRGLDSTQISAIQACLRELDAPVAWSAFALEAWERMSARELASQFGCTAKTVHNHANKLFGKAQNGVARTFDEAQVTMLLESVKASGFNSRGNQHRANEEVETLKAGLQGIETELTLDLQIALAEKAEKEAAQKSRDLWKRKAKQNEARAVKADAVLGRLTVEHKDVLKANAQLWRIAESAGAITSDREDMLALYRR